MSAPSQSALAQSVLAEGLVRDFTAQQPIRAGSFIVTIYGDAVAPRGGTLSLASLLGLMSEVGASESLVRTAVSRLAADGWLSGRRRGRHSFYSLTETGSRRFEAATRRIYLGAPADWSGDWEVVLLPGGAGERRESLRKSLRWLGFGQAGPAVMIHPQPDREALAALLAEPGAAEAALLISGSADLSGKAPVLARLVAESWDLEALAEGYRRFLVRFRPLGAALAGGSELAPLSCLLVRLLLIHDYRKVILRDPALPAVLLPEDWPGREAQALCREVYEAVVTGAEAWVSENLRRDDGPLPPAGEAFWTRFGGLRPQSA